MGPKCPIFQWSTSLDSFTYKCFSLYVKRSWLVDHLKIGPVSPDSNAFKIWTCIMFGIQMNPVIRCPVFGWLLYVLVFFSPTVRLRHWDVTSFCVQLENRLDRQWLCWGWVCDLGMRDKEREKEKCQILSLNRAIATYVQTILQCAEKSRIMR